MQWTLPVSQRLESKTLTIQHPNTDPNCTSVLMIGEVDLRVELMRRIMRVIIDIDDYQLLY